MSSNAEPNQIDSIINVLALYSSPRSNRGLQFFSGIDGWILMANSSCVALSLLSAFLSRFSGNMRSKVVLLSYIFLAASELGFVVQALRSSFSAIKLVGRPVHSVLKTLGPPLNHDYELLLRLRSYDKPSLEFMSRRLTMEADQFRSRIGIFVGAIEKVGIVPLAVGAFITGWKFKEDTHPPLSYIVVGVAGMLLLYLLGVILTMSSSKLEKLADLVTMAAEKENETADCPELHSEGSALAGE
jgi:hypothetical protein